jgi:hypothetical protein
MDFAIDPFEKRSKIPRDDPAGEHDTKVLRSSTRSRI